VTDEEESPVFERGDVVYGDDPFKSEENARPWLVLSNHEGRPFHAEQYIAVTLTSQSWMDGLVDIPDGSWVCGGTPEESRVVPWGIQSIDHEDNDFWQAVWRAISSTRLLLPSSKNFDSGCATRTHPGYYQEGTSSDLRAGTSPRRLIFPLPVSTRPNL
jgi:mRNA-degrading endonuclease toxin of MazEF toxin-antitoxin module